jgi:hypothetical protein
MGRRVSLEQNLAPAGSCRRVPSQLSGALDDVLAVMRASRARGHRRQAPRRSLRARPPHRRLAQAQAPPARDLRRHRMAPCRTEGTSTGCGLARTRERRRQPSTRRRGPTWAAQRRTRSPPPSARTTAPRLGASPCSRPSCERCRSRRRSRAPSIQAVRSQGQGRVPVRAPRPARALDVGRPRRRVRLRRDRAGCELRSPPGLPASASSAASARSSCCDSSYAPRASLKRPRISRRIRSTRSSDIRA